MNMEYKHQVNLQQKKAKKESFVSGSDSADSNSSHSDTSLSSDSSISSDRDKNNQKVKKLNFKCCY